MKTMRILIVEDAPLVAARAVTRSDFLDIALVEPPKSIASPDLEGGGLRRAVDVGCLSGLQLRNMPGNGSVVCRVRQGK